MEWIVFGLGALIAGWWLLPKINQALTPTPVLSRRALMFMLSRSRIMPEMVGANSLVLLSGWISDKTKALDEFKLRPREQIVLELAAWVVAELEAIVEYGPSADAADSVLGEGRSVFDALRIAKPPLVDHS